MSALVDGLGVNGKFMTVGASMEAIEVTPVQLISERRSIQGWSAGVAIDSEDTLGFAAMTGVRPMTENFPFTEAVLAYERMISGTARFRDVLNMS